MESLAQLEVLCERLYNSQDSAERTHAENTLKCFSTNIDYISQCQYILDNALTPYALMLASSSLLKQVTEHSLSLQLRLDIRNYLINYLANRGPELQPFVIGSLVQLLCRLTKFGWFDDDRFRDVAKESINFLNQATSDHYAIGLKILNQLVCEMNQPNPGLPSSHHRRVACSFRDQCLFQIFQISLTSLHQLKNDAISRLQELALSLSLKCLSFDFVGTSIDESSEEFGTVQIPSSWKPVLEDFSTLQIFFDYYALTKPPISKESLECLVRLASVRRSLFTNDVTRSKFLDHLMSGTKEILRTGQGLADHDNYHEFCRLLGRFRVNYQQLYARLSDLIGLNDHLLLLDFIVQKIAKISSVIQSYMTGKLLLKLDTVKFIIAHHTREHFPFLEEYRCSRSRTTFYYTIGWLIFLEDSAALFKSSMDPLLQVFITLESTPETMFRTDSVKYALIGLMRDLRGIAMATNSRRTYGLLFDWIYPAHMPILLRGISHWADTPEVTTPLLKFMAEFVLNKAQRLTFDTSSPNGILLFREVSKLLVAYGSRILSLSNATDIYGFKYKGIWISLTILSRALAGNYVNFGVFDLYGDRALADALDIALKMTLSIPLADILAYRKVCLYSTCLFWKFCSTAIVFVLSLDTHTFMHIVGSLESGLKGLDAGISSQCASAIDNLAAFYFNNITMGEAPTSAPAANLARHIAECPAVLPEILKPCLIVLFEDCSNQWSLSRPMLSLILINEQMFTDLKAHILASQPVDQHQRLISCFDKLMSDITRGLDSKNRDKFTQNLTIFRHDFRVK
ncbi:UNVERIFIED_CONTAM: Exportin-7-A [Sesamum angustifolium]|uniref:Exportin-7-A n=1 Tax=Sesamum angustifolium TaxID=2727405 RepID=A0AAW2RJ61_9LAMI